MKIAIIRWGVVTAALLLNLSGVLGQSLDSVLHSYMLQGRMGQAIVRAEQQLQLHKGALSAVQQADYYNNLCEAYRRKGNFEKAEYYRNKSVERIMGVRDSVVITCNQLTLAELFMMQNRLDSAVTYLRRAQSYAERANNKLLLNRVYRNMGGILLASAKNEEALSYYLKSYGLTSQFLPAYSLANDEMGIGMAYLAMMKPDSSIVYLQRALESGQRIGDTIAVTLAYALMSNYHMQQGETAKAKRYLVMSIDLADKSGHQILLANGYNMLMAEEIAAKNYQQAIVYGLEARKRIGRNRIPVFEASIDKLLSEAYKGAGDYARALQCFESFYEVEKEAQLQTHMDAIREQEKAFLLKEKNLKIENQQLQLQNSQRRQRVMALIILLLLSVMAGLAFFGGLRKRYQRRLFRKEKMMESIIASERSKLSTTAEEQIDRVDVANLHDEYEGELETFSEDRRDLYAEMLRIIEQQKLYLNPELNQKLLITLLGTNRKYLYQAISQNAEENFKQMINRYRVDEAKRLIEERVDVGTDTSLEDIHALAGFNSVTSYYRAFKFFTGLTPRDYQLAYKQEYTSRGMKKGWNLSN